MPSDSHTPKKRTASTSTNVTSPRSNTTPDPVASICALSSGRESAWTRPINLMVVRCSSRIVSIFRVTPKGQCNDWAVGKCRNNLPFRENMFSMFSENADISANSEVQAKGLLVGSISSAICDGPLIAPCDIEILAMSRRSKDRRKADRGEWQERGNDMSDVQVERTEALTSRRCAGARCQVEALVLSAIS
jgi:hypothetical protein